jgi:hypothetical protein
MDPTPKEVLMTPEAREVVGNFVSSLTRESDEVVLEVLTHLQNPETKKHLCGVLQVNPGAGETDNGGSNGTATNKVATPETGGKPAAKKRRKTPVRIDRERMDALLAAGNSVTQVAAELGCTPNAIYTLRKVRAATPG